MTNLAEHITLREHTTKQVFLELRDVRCLQHLQFQVTLCEMSTANEADAPVAYFVNPTSCVGHFLERSLQKPLSY
jgi:hypothetical protein